MNQPQSKYNPNHKYIRIMDDETVEYWELIEWVIFPINAKDADGGIIEHLDDDGRWKAKVSRDRIQWFDCWTDDCWVDEGGVTLELAVDKYLKRKAVGFVRS